MSEQNKTWYPAIEFAVRPRVGVRRKGTRTKTTKLMKS